MFCKYSCFLNKTLMPVNRSNFSKAIYLCVLNWWSHLQKLHFRSGDVVYHKHCCLMITVSNIHDANLCCWLSHCELYVYVILLLLTTPVPFHRGLNIFHVVRRNDEYTDARLVMFQVGSKYRFNWALLVLLVILPLYDSHSDINKWPTNSKERHTLR